MSRNERESIAKIIEADFDEMLRDYLGLKETDKVRFLFAAQYIGEVDGEVMENTLIGQGGFDFFSDLVGMVEQIRTRYRVHSDLTFLKEYREREKEKKAKENVTPEVAPEA